MSRDDGTTRRRAAMVLISAASALIVWTLATYALGVEVTTPAMGGDDGAVIGAGVVVLTSLAAGLAGWASLAILERSTRRASTRLWRWAALGALLASFGGPFGGPTDAASRTTLVLLHLVVGVGVGPGAVSPIRPGT